jgi:hypothetical protein
MTIQSWQHIIDLVRNGEPVSAEVANRAISQLVQRTEHLKDRQDAQDFAQALFISDAPLASSVRTGHAVYFDPQSNKFAAAYADIEFKDGMLQPTPSSSVVGIVMYKNTADSGVILVEGWVDPDNYQDMDCESVAALNNLLMDSSYRGILYLASGAANAGKLSSKPGLLSIPVCNLVSANHMLVRPPVTTAINTQALKFKLFNEVAGYGLVLVKGADSSAAAFTATWPVGTEVEVFVSNVVNPLSVTDKIYLTGKISRYVGSNTVQLEDISFTKQLVKDLEAAEFKYADVFKSSNTVNLKIKNLDTGLSETVSTGGFISYVSPVTYDNVIGWYINSSYVNANKPGWLPADNPVFDNAIKPVGAKYGYNVNKDPVLQQLFPEDIVTAYLVTKSGVGMSDQIVEVNSSGIWWKDSIAELPWRTIKINNTNLSVLPDVQVNLANWTAAEEESLIMPTELHLVYAKLATGGARLVTSLQAAENTPLIVTDPFGNPASSGPLVIRAGLEINETATSETGSLVVKNFEGFNMKRGRVVERIIAGENVQLTSTFSGGQGEVSISVIGLDGKLEGQPDILAIDDVLVERDSSNNVFYSVFPPGKSSSIMGKVDVPDYLSGNYIALLYTTFIALHTTGASQLPTLTLNSYALPGLGTKANLSQLVSAAPTSVQPYPTPVNSKDCMKVAATLANSVIPGSSIFFKLTRNAVAGGGDSYAAKLGVISFVYKFIKIPS